MFYRLTAQIISAVLLVITTLLAPPITRAASSHPGSQQRIYAPYLFLHAPDPNSSADYMVKISRESGIKLFTLAFMVSSGNDCQAAWFPNLPLPQENTIAEQIQHLRKSGGDVILSFGGEGGLELAQVCNDVSGLQAQYQVAIDQYKLRMLDFDIESTAILDPPSIDRRNQAIAKLQIANPGLLVSYTLPVLPTGLLPNALDLLTNAVSHGVGIGNINIMTMDYHLSSDPRAMGQNAIAAANATIKQLESINLDAPLGLTPMIGVNDVSPEVFTLDDARRMLSYAKSTKRVRRIAMWSVARDRNCTGAPGLQTDCSGVPQKDFAFSKLFGKF